MRRGKLLATALFAIVGIACGQGQAVITADAGLATVRAASFAQGSGRRCFQDFGPGRGLTLKCD